MLSRWWGKILGFLAAVATADVEVWMGFQTRPATGRWSSPFYWRPLPLLLACSLVLLLATIVFGASRRGRIMGMIVTFMLAAWWIPVALIAVSYHFWPSPLETEAVAFPWFLVVPAALLLGSLLSQILFLRQTR